MVILYDNKITSSKSISHLKSFARKLKVNVKSIQYEDGLAYFELNDFQKSIALKKGAVDSDQETFLNKSIVGYKRTSLPNQGVTTTQKKKSSVRKISKKGKENKKRRDLFFEKIWNEREHKSEVSGQPLRFKFSKEMYFVFSHVVTKGAYPRLEFKKENIVLMTREEHRLWENFRYKLEDKEEWKWVFELHDRLIEDYWNQS